MREPSFFSRVTKYASDHNSDPRENRLTEAFAALLTQVDGLALALALDWLDPDNYDTARGERCAKETRDAFDRLSGENTTVSRISTQVLRYLTQRRWVDLEIDFECGGEPQKVRVEVKHGADPHDLQVQDYQQRDESGSPRVPVVLLAPSWQLPFGGEGDEEWEGAPASAPQRSWQSAVEIIKDFEINQSDPAQEPIARWMRDEFVKFAEEEELMPLEAIDTEGAARIANLRRSKSALEELVRCARKIVVTEWGEEGQSSSAGNGVGSYKHYPTVRYSEGRSSWPDNIWFEFKVSADGAVPPPEDGSDGEVVFIAGLTWERGKASLDEVDSERLRGLVESDDPFSEFVENNCARFMRVRSPKLLVNQGDTLEKQGQALGEWVVQAFKDLNNA